MLNEPQRTPTPWQMVMGLNQYVQQLQCQVNDQQALIDRLCQQIEALNERMNAAENKPYYHVDTIQYHFDQLKVEKLSGTLNIGMSAPSDDQIKEIGQLVMPGNGGNGNVQVNGNATGNGISNGIGIGNQVGAGVVNDPIKSAESGMDPEATNTPHQFPAPSALGIPPAVSPPYPYPEIRHAIDCYLDQNAPRQLRQLEAETGIALDPYHQRLIIEDIRKQMSQRIQFYIQMAAREAGKGEGKSGGSAEAVSDLQEQVIRKTERDIDMALRNYVGRLLGNP